MSLLKVGAFVMIMISIYVYVNNSASDSGSELKDQFPQTPGALLQYLQDRTSSAKIQLQRVAIGYNTNLDLICPGVDILESMNVFPSELVAHETISTVDEFASTFGHFFTQGSAAERQASNAEVWTEITSHLANIECKYSYGGNAAIIANRFAELQIPVIYLGGPVGEKLQSLLHPSIRLMSEFLPKDQKTEDEIHLIMEYSTNEQWKSLKSPRANRFIISHDLQNSYLQAVEFFHEHLDTFDPQVLLFAGVHLLDGISHGQQQARLHVLKEKLKSISKNTLIHMEIAGVGNNTFLKVLAEGLLPIVDSIGLNEQELGTLYLALGGKEYSLQDFTAPTVPVATNAIKFIINQPFLQNSKNKLHHLGRVHLHFLSYHVICQPVIDSETTFYQWSREKASEAVIAGSLATTRQACGENGQLPSVSDISFRYFPQSEQDVHFVQDGLEFWVAPVAICNTPVRTVGLGDTISTNGMAFHYA